MSIIGWIIFGALVGWIASALTGEREGCLTHIVIGIAGALIGGFIFFTLIGRSPMPGFHVGSIFVSVVGAVLLLTLLRALRTRPY
ncbi:MAG TPA: GlsB/YeaQ/YmgE family stress response membrane protein [Armatimonadota bacterium]|jgi:uncharacterized membrane protein YeaQ/YmgE (transglycosylase-associated protein family)